MRTALHLGMPGDCTPVYDGVGVRMESRWGEGVWGAPAALGDRLAVLGPALLVAVTLIALALVLGGILRALVTRIARGVGFDNLMERWGMGASLRGSGVLRTPSDVL